MVALYVYLASLEALLVVPLGAMVRRRSTGIYK